METTYVSPLSPKECLERLRAHAYTFSDLLKYSFYRVPAEGTVFVKRSGERIRIHAQGARNVRNPFIPFFYGRVSPCAEGTRISGKIAPLFFIRLFMTLWMGGVILFFLGGLAAVVVAPSIETLIFLAAASFLLAFGGGFLWLGTRLGGKQKDYIHRFLEETLQAKPQ